MKMNLIDIKENKLISKYYKKPNTLTKFTKARYLELLRDEDKFKYFISIISRKRLNSKNMINYLIYLEYCLEKENIFNKKLIDNISNRLYYTSSCGMLKVYDTQIIKYIKANLRSKDFLDEELLSEIKKAKTVTWNKNHTLLLKYENNILKLNKKNINENLEKYLSLLNKEFKLKNITKKMLLETKTALRNKISLEYSRMSTDAYEKYVSEKNRKKLEV